VFYNEVSLPVRTIISGALFLKIMCC